MEKITPEEFKELIRDLNTFDCPPAVMIFGEPGIGKSYASKEIAEELKREYMPLSLGRLEAYDIKGMPDLSKEFMVWKPPQMWNDIIKKKGNVLLHFDEFTLADEAVQGAVLDIVQMKKIDDIKLPDNTMIVISGNMGGDDGTFAKSITSALTGGRSMVFQMKKPSLREWLAYQQPCKIIKDFLTANPTHLYRGPNLVEPFSPWTCPRSWSLYDIVIKKLEIDSQSDMASRKKAIRYAKSMLSEETVNIFIDFMENSLIEVMKVLDREEMAVEKFLKADNFRQAGLIKEAVKQRITPKASKLEKFQGLLDLLVKREMPKELIALFAEQLVKEDPEILVSLMINKMTLDTWADKLAYDTK
ncbi:MAG: ATP-binding protein [bacterium]